jgi:hypothetical protein
MSHKQHLTDQQIEEYLSENGSPPHVVRAGRSGLIKRWQAFVDEVEGGYRLGLEDYRNDLDLRGILATLGLDDDHGVEQADLRLLKILEPTAKRIWESCEGNHFWDFGYPRNATGELLNDLRREGFIAPR